MEFLTPTLPIWTWHWKSTVPSRPFSRTEACWPVRSPVRGACPKEPPVKLSVEKEMFANFSWLRNTKARTLCFCRFFDLTETIDPESWTPRHPPMARKMKKDTVLGFQYWSKQTPQLVRSVGLIISRTIIPCFLPFFHPHGVHSALFRLEVRCLGAEHQLHLR